MRHVVHEKYQYAYLYCVSLQMNKNNSNYGQVIESEAFYKTQGSVRILRLLMRVSKKAFIGSRKA